ncbi:MAG: hypothetical protein ACJ74Y_00720 [Bryobacteraceae bacterium]
MSSSQKPDATDSAGLELGLRIRERYFESPGLISHTLARKFGSRSIAQRLPLLESLQRRSHSLSLPGWWTAPVYAWPHWHAESEATFPFGPGYGTFPSMTRAATNIPSVMSPSKRAGFETLSTKLHVSPINRSTSASRVLPAQSGSGGGNSLVQRRLAEHPNFGSHHSDEASPSTFPNIQASGASSVHSDPTPLIEDSSISPLSITKQTQAQLRRPSPALPRENTQTGSAEVPKDESSLTSDALRHSNPIAIEQARIVRRNASRVGKAFTRTPDQLGEKSNPHSGLRQPKTVTPLMDSASNAGPVKPGSPLPKTAGEGFISAARFGSPLIRRQVASPVKDKAPVGNRPPASPEASWKGSELTLGTRLADRHLAMSTASRHAIQPVSANPISSIQGVSSRPSSVAVPVQGSVIGGPSEILRKQSTSVSSPGSAYASDTRNARSNPETASSAPAELIQANVAESTSVTKLASPAGVAETTSPTELVHASVERYSETNAEVPGETIGDRILVPSANASTREAGSAPDVHRPLISRSATMRGGVISRKEAGSRPGSSGSVTPGQTTWSDPPRATSSPTISKIARTAHIQRPASETPVHRVAESTSDQLPASLNPGPPVLRSGPATQPREIPGHLQEETIVSRSPSQRSRIEPPNSSEPQASNALGGSESDFKVPRVVTSASGKDSGMMPAIVRRKTEAGRITRARAVEGRAPVSATESAVLPLIVHQEGTIVNRTSHSEHSEQFVAQVASPSNDTRALGSAPIVQQPSDIAPHAEPAYVPVMRQSLATVTGRTLRSGSFGTERAVSSIAQQPVRKFATPWNVGSSFAIATPGMLLNGKAAPLALAGAVPESSPFPSSLRVFREASDVSMLHRHAYPGSSVASSPASMERAAAQSADAAGSSSQFSPFAAAAAQNANTSRAGAVDLPHLADEVYGLLVRRLASEQQRRGF